MSSLASNNAITAPKPPATSPSRSHPLLSPPLLQSLRSMFTTTSNLSSIFQRHLGPQPPSMCLARPSFNIEPPSLHLYLVECAVPVASPRTRKIFSVKVNRMPCRTDHRRHGCSHRVDDESAGRLCLTSRSYENQIPDRGNNMMALPPNLY